MSDSCNTRHAPLPALAVMRTTWQDILAAINTVLGGDPEQGQHDLRTCWAAKARPTMLTGAYRRTTWLIWKPSSPPKSDGMTKLLPRSRTSVTLTWCREAYPLPLPLPLARPGLAPSLHLNLGDGYLRQGRTPEARDQLNGGLAALSALPDDGYGAMVRRGLTGLEERISTRP